VKIVLVLLQDVHVKTVRVYDVHVVNLALLQLNKLKVMQTIEDLWDTYSQDLQKFIASRVD